MKDETIPITAVCVCGPGKKKYLERALRSVDFSSQKIFISDRCDDEVIEVASGLGWEIFHWLGRDSMCERRNYSIAWRGNEDVKPEWTTNNVMSKKHPVIKNNWILQVDDDEVYDENLRRCCCDVVKEGNVFLDAVSVHLKNIADDGSEMSVVPLPRIFKNGRVHWEKDIQNDVCYAGETAWIPVVMRHYGYGSLLGHWEKQWKRMKMNEDHCRENPFDLDARGYLINCLAVVGGDHLNRARLLGHVGESIRQFKSRYKNDKSSQLVIERILRHLWSTCANCGNYSVFMSVLSRVDKYIDWIVDVHYWKVVCVCNSGVVDWNLVDRYGRDYIRAMEDHRKPPIMNIEVQSIDEEVDVCEQVYGYLVQLLSDMRVARGGLGGDEYDNARMDIAKRARWWKKQKDKQIYLRLLRDNGINYHGKKNIFDNVSIIYENEFYINRFLEDMRK